MGKIAIKDLQSDQAAVSKALAAIKDPKANPTGDAPGDNSTTAHENRNFYYDDRTTYRDYVKAYNKLSKDQADYLGDNPTPNSADMQALDKMYNDARTSNNLGGDELHGQALIDALKGNKDAIDPTKFNADKAISLGGRLYQGEDLAHRTDAQGNTDLSSGPMDTRYTDYVGDGGTHELNGHLLTQAEDSSGKSLKNLDDLSKNVSARAFYMANNEGKDPASGNILDQFKDANGKVIHDAPFVQTSDGKIYYPVYDGGDHYLQKALQGQRVSASSAAAIAQHMTEDDKYAWVEKDTRGWFQTALDVLGSAPAAFALLPLDPLFGLASKGVSAVAAAGVAAGRAALGRATSAVAGSAEAVSTKLIREGVSSLPAPKATNSAGETFSTTGGSSRAGTQSTARVVTDPSATIGNEDFLADANLNPKFDGAGGFFSSTKYRSFWDAQAAKAAQDAGKGDAYTEKLLYGETGIPRVQDAPQGSVDDCWLMGGLQYRAQRAPDTIMNNIRSVGNGNFQVKLFDKQGRPRQVTVNSDLPADGKGNLYFGGSTDDGIWAALYEKAAAKLASFDGRAGTTTTGYATLTGGTGEAADAILTGAPSGTNSFVFSGTGNTWKRGTMTEEPGTSGVGYDNITSQSEEEVKAAIQTSLRGDRPVLAQVQESITQPVQLIGPHSYSVIDYDPAGPDGGTLTLLNPHPGSATGLDHVQMSLKALEDNKIPLYLPQP